MTDVHLFQTPDGGDVKFASDDLETDLALDATGLEAAAYLSMFGGNYRDPGTLRSGEDRPGRFQWWGNIGAPESEKLRSETQYFLRSMVPTSGNLRGLELAIGRDLDWFVKDKIASSTSASASLVSRHQVNITVNIVVRGQEYVFRFLSAWEVE